ncbi:MAG: porin [Candidatus Abawacabacteria bacterium RIFCSPHIGHO2_01_FULL_46_8]|uniref:Porin n=1 Tax=Candidatus Abawacabacteria bacterium RIFCSPHIGHO2_01_FULL_46_8 TaxID=1817815 RepID=A0A1F4XN06_9BACT|nr:MAG: porin [Candidatus Abawacabacteria bacterium RIFCSPHIGHO2_01_FULL_46_8]
MMKKYLVEFIGTFFLVLTVIVAVRGTAGSLAPIAIGSILMVMVYAGGHISGGHYNPAVTLGVWLRGKCQTSDVPGYIIAQLLGGVIAAFLGVYLATNISGAAETITMGTFDFTSGVLAEFLGTFALVWVVLNTATAKGTSGNSFYGLAIGFTIVAGIYGLGGITGGAFNPAVAVGISLAKMTSWANLSAFLVGQIAAGISAALTFKYINGDK